MANNMIVRTNIPATQAHRSMNNASGKTATASHRMAGGLRINSAADDVAGMGVTEKMRSQVHSLDQAARNNQDSVCLVQVADGAMDTVNDAVIRIRELVIKAANDTYTGSVEMGGERFEGVSDRGAIQSEIDLLLDEINQTTTRVQYSSRMLVDGSLSGFASNADFNPQAPLWSFDPLDFNPDGFQFQLADPIDVSRQNINNFVAEQLAAWAESLGHDTIQDFYSSFGYPNMQSAFDAGLLNTPLAIALQGLFTQNPEGAIKTDTANALWFQIGANDNHGVRMHIGTFSSRLLGIENISVQHDRGEVIQNQIAALDIALAKVTQQRGILGAVQNRLEFGEQNVRIASENLSEATSRIRDADMALESMNLAKGNILSQSAQAMLAMANQAPNQVLELLQ